VFEGTKPISQADPATFRYGGSDETGFTAEDKDNYFWNDTAYKKSECREVGKVLACKNYIIAGGLQYSQIDPVSLHYVGKLSDNGCGGIAVRSRIYQNKDGIYAIDGAGGVRKLGFIANKVYETLDSSLESQLCGGFPNPVEIKPDFYPR
jgi:hypothetical protein